MRMASGRFGALLVGAGVAFVTGAMCAAVAQQGGAEDEAAMMEAYVKAGQPGEHHKRLEPFIGDWTIKVSHWTAPGSEPSTSEGEAHIEWIMDGRFIQEEIVGDMGEMMPGVEFKGRGVTGYDNLRKEYVSTWIDSMSTGVAISYGKWDARQKAIVATGEMMDPMTGAPKKFRWITTIAGPDRIVSESYAIGDGGEETREMQIIYTRN